MIEPGAGLRDERQARVHLDAVTLDRGRQLQRDDVERTRRLEAQRALPAVRRRGGKPPDRAELLELVKRHQSSLLDLRRHARHQRALDPQAVRGPQSLERKQALEQLAEVDGLALHGSSCLPAGRP